MRTCTALQKASYFYLLLVSPGGSFLANFRAAGEGLVWAATHLDFLGLPVNLWNVFLKPSEAQYDILFPQVGDCKGSPLGVVVVAQYRVYDFSDRACVVSVTVHIKYRDRVGESAGSQAIPTDEFRVHELSGRSTINQCGC